MAIVVRCSCGQSLRVPESAAGTRVRCKECRAVLAVPAREGAPRPEPAADRPDRPSPASRSASDDLEDRPQPRRGRTTRRAPKRAARPRKLWLAVALGAAAVLLLGCVGLGAAGLYYFGSSGSSDDSQLVGDWETDPEAYLNEPMGMMFIANLTVNKDHTYRMNFAAEVEGKWKVVRRDGNTFQVRLTMKVMGLEGDNPPTMAFRLRDKDHLEIDSDHPSWQLHVKLRRVGTGPPYPRNLAEAEALRKGRPAPAPPLKPGSGPGAGPAPPGGAGPRPSQPPDRSGLKGDWVATAAEQDGKRLPDEFVKGAGVTFAGGKYKSFLGDIVEEGVFKVDRTKRPNTIDMIPSGGRKKSVVMRAIFELDGETLKICWNLTTNQRPKDFTSTAENKQFLVVYTRKK